MPGDKTVPFSSEDADMEAAIRQAKSNFRHFIEAFSHPTEQQKSFLVKVVFDERDQREHIWLADLDFRGERPSGVVANEPNLPSLKFMQRVEFEPSYISDWMFIEDGYLVGGYTTRVIRSRMTPEERREHDARAPYKFREAGQHQAGATSNS
jgi:uncharacterized protein YegJ (DUF2314 family)